jgi:putative ABC transport system substrate-binding protein
VTTPSIFAPLPPHPAQVKGTVLQTRRMFLRAVGAAVAGTALAACAGRPALAPAKVYRVGYVNGATEAQASRTELLRQALREIGYVEGGNLVLEVRYAAGRADRFTAIADEFAALKLDVIVTSNPQALLALKQATSSIPIVMAAGFLDPVATGLAKSLARPGGNVTGTLAAGSALSQRQVQLLKETLPTASRVAYLGAADSGAKEARGAASALGIDLQAFAAGSAEAVAEMLAAAGRSHPDAVVVTGAGQLVTEQTRILEFLVANRLPSMTSAVRSYVDRGALMFYDENEVDAFERAAGYVDRILKGTDPAEMPIQQASKFDFIINLKTARALGLTIPPSVLAQATELIQ